MDFSVHRTISGERLANLTPAAASWTRSGNMLDPGEGTFVFVPGADGVSPADWRSFSEGWANTIVVHNVWGPQYAGVVMERSWDPYTRRLTVKTREVGVFLTVRLLYPVGEMRKPDIIFSKRSPRGILIESVRIALSGSAAGNWNLPVGVPASEAGSITVTYVRADQMTAKEWIEAQAPNVQGDLVPVIREDGGLSWRLEAGSPLLDRGTVEVNMLAPKIPLTSFSTSDSYLRQLTGAFAVGKGMGAAMKRAEADSIAAGGLPRWDMPYLDATVSMKDIGHQTVLDRAVLAELKRRRLGKREVSFDWSPGNGWPFLMPGMSVRLTGADPFLGQYDLTRRIKSVGGDAGSQVQKLTLEVSDV